MAWGVQSCDRNSFSYLKSLFVFGRPRHITAVFAANDGQTFELGQLRIELSKDHVHLEEFHRTILELPPAWSQ